MKAIPPENIEEFLGRISRGELDFEDCEALRKAVKEYQSEDKENHVAVKIEGTKIFLNSNAQP